MKPKRKILVAYDGSEYGEAALHDLKRAGLGTNVEALVVTIVDVFVPPPGDEQVYTPEAIKRAHERAQQTLDEAKHTARRASESIKLAFSDWQVRCEVEADSPAWAVIRKADEWKPDLVLMGSRGHSVFGGRLILGSISQRVLYEARCSVRVARGSGRANHEPVRILVGVDHSSDSIAAVDAICDRDWPRDTEVGLLAVVDTVMAIPTDPVGQSAVKWIEVGKEEDWDHVRESFAPAAQRLRDAGLRAEILVRRGNPADQILQEAHTWGADCIFVGARGTRGIERLLLGSVSSAVSSRAHCSVEVVRPKK
jgi:nucleotide-binding universal stress UspA family protein